MPVIAEMLMAESEVLPVIALMLNSKKKHSRTYERIYGIWTGSLLYMYYSLMVPIPTFPDEKRRQKMLSTLSVPSTCKIFFIVSVDGTCQKSPAVSYWPVFPSLLFSPLPLA